jgi:2-keto-4-pentenoate hydratase
VQARLIADRINSGARIVGRKIGLTSEAVQRQLGVDRPDFGYLLDDMDLTGEPSIPMDRLIQPKVEAEIAFILGQDLTASDLDAVSVRAAVDHMRPALEIVDSRIQAWDITFGDTVADNASSGLFVLGDAKVALERSQPSATEMTMTLDGHEVSADRGKPAWATRCMRWPGSRTPPEISDPLYSPARSSFPVHSGRWPR